MNRPPAITTAAATGEEEKQQQLPPSPAAGQKRPRPLTPTSSAASLPTLVADGGGDGAGAGSTGSGGSVAAASASGGAAAAVSSTGSSSPSPSPWGGVFPFRAAGPRMRVERAYDPAAGEHRCLVYRADRRAPVAKIIWTTALQEDDEGDEEGKKEEEGRRDRSLASASAAAAVTGGDGAADGVNGGAPPQRQQGGEEGTDEERGQEMVVLGARRRVAHVKSVFVHESMRGSGLGRLLFFQLFATLRRQWHGHLGLLKLEAEEDTRRHDKLVRYYQSLGFRPTPHARVLYLSHEDACFRKVPMYREIPSSSASALSSLLGPEELDAGASFTVVVLRASGDDGCSERSSKCGGGGGGEEQQRMWVLVQDAAGGVSMLESQVGRFLCAEPDGTVVADRPVLSTWELFELESYELPPSEGEGQGEGQEGGQGEGSPTSREVFAFRTFHGKYLRLADGNGASNGSGRPLALALTTAEEPTLWEISGGPQGGASSGGGSGVVGGGNGGGSSSGRGSGGGGGGPRVIEVVREPCLQGLRKKCAQEPKQATVRAVHRKMRRINSVAFVEQMRGKWGRMDAMARFRQLMHEKRRAEAAARATAAGEPMPVPEPESLEQKEEEEELSVEGAVRRLCTHLDPLQPALADRGVSYGHALLWIAEFIRSRGHPEWLQLVGLLHGLGRLAFALFLEASRDFQSEYEDWTFGGQSWVVGCRFPDSIRYPEVNELNPDHEDPRYASSATGMYEPHCGLDAVLLNFSGGEYLWLLLQQQAHCLPPEALAMVRYVDLDLWHTQGHYGELATPADEAMREPVRAFYQLRAEALAALPAWASGAQPPVSMERVWPYYQALVDKYLPEGLQW